VEEAEKYYSSIKEKDEELRSAVQGIIDMVILQGIFDKGYIKPLEVITKWMKSPGHAKTVQGLFNTLQKASPKKKRNFVFLDSVDVFQLLAKLQRHHFKKKPLVFQRPELRSLNS
jgi:hypothetical protein